MGSRNLYLQFNSAPTLHHLCPTNELQIGTIPQKAYSNKNNFVLWVCLFCCCLPNCRRRASLSTCARAGGSCFCLSAWRSTETQSCVPPRSFQALGAWNDWKKWTPWSPSWLETRILKSWRLCIFYTLVAWKFATTMGILISLLVGSLIVIPIMACDHPTLPHSNCDWIIPRGWKQVPFLAAQGIRSDQWWQWPLFDLLLNDWSLGLLLEGCS